MWQTAKIAQLRESCLQTCGKWLVFFHGSVGGFSIGISGSFPYFHGARKLFNDQPPHCQRHIPHRYNQPPRQNETADHAADYEVQRKQGNPSTQGAAARYNPEAHPMETKWQPAEYPEPYKVELSVLHAGGFEDAIQDQRHSYGQYTFEEKRLDCFASCHRENLLLPLYYTECRELCQGLSKNYSSSCCCSCPFGMLSNASTFCLTVSYSCASLLV